MGPDAIAESLPAPYERPWERSSLAEARSTRRPDPARRRRVAVLGDGISALACAHYLIRAGLEPVLLSPSTLGSWLAERFPVGPHRLDGFHAPLRASDSALCGMLADLDLAHTVVWRRARIGLYAVGAQRFVRTRHDLRVLTPRSWTELLSRMRQAPAADPGPVAGCYHSDVFQGWRHRSLRRDGCLLCSDGGSGRVTRQLIDDIGGGGETYGYLRGGHRALVDALASSIVARGGRLLRGVRLHAIEADAGGATVEWDAESETFDAVLSTLPLAQLTKLARGRVVRWLPFPEGTSQGEVSVVVLLRQRLDLPYLTLPFGPHTPFHQVYSAGDLVPENERGQLHPIYLVRGAETHAQDYRAADQTLVQAALALLGQLGPRFDAAWVESTRVFRTPQVDLTWSRLQLDRPPTRRVGPSRLFLCTAARPYPRSPSTDTSVMLARDTVSQLAYQI